MSLLDGIKANKAIDIVLASGNPKDKDVVHAVNRLRQIGRNAVPKLIDALLEAPNHQIIENLLATLIDSKSLPEYMDALTDSDRQLVMAVARILIKSNSYDPNHLLPYIDDADVPKKILLQILVAKKDRLNYRKLIGALENADKNKQAMIFHLIQASTNPELIPYLAQHAESNNLGIRMQSIKALAKYDSEHVKKVLLRALSDSNKMIRLAALDGLSSMNSKIPIEYICPLLKDPDMTIQAKAIDALISAQDPNIVSYLIEILNDDSEYVRRAAVEILNELADPRAIKNLLNAMRDSDWWVRVRAADALGSIGGPRVVEAIINLLRDEDEFLRRTAVEILNSVKDERAYFYLIQALEDNDWWVRERAVDALSQLGDARAIPDLLSALDKYPESSHVLIQALVTLGDDSIVSQLLEKAHAAKGDARKEMLLAISEFAKKEQIDDSIENVKTSVIDRAEINDPNPQVNSENTTVHNPLTTADASPEQRENSAGILDLSATDTVAAEVAQIFDASKFMPGYVIANRYRMVKQIGKGAFGIVVLVEDMMVNEEIILKFLNAHMSSDENIIQRFIHELRYARKITHENIIRIYDFITFGKSYAISMEYFASHSLSYEMKINRKANRQRMLKIYCDICKGVAYAHSLNIVHRDLKPANILIGDDDMVKIVDFGLAAAASSGDSRITRTGILVGTPTYMAPEQVRARTIDQRTDIYSLGVLLYEIFVGRAPYKGEDHLATLFQHVEGKAVVPHKANPDVDEELSDVIMKAMAVNPTERYQTADEFRLALEQLLEKEAA